MRNQQKLEDLLNEIRKSTERQDWQIKGKYLKLNTKMTDGSTITLMVYMKDNDGSFAFNITIDTLDSDSIAYILLWHHGDTTIRGTSVNTIVSNVKTIERVKNMNTVDFLTDTLYSLTNRYHRYDENWLNPEDVLNDPFKFADIPVNTLGDGRIALIAKKLANALIVG